MWTNCACVLWKRLPIINWCKCMFPTAKDCLSSADVSACFLLQKTAYHHIMIESNACVMVLREKFTDGNNIQLKDSNCIYNQYYVLVYGNICVTCQTYLSCIRLGLGHSTASWKFGRLLEFSSDYVNPVCDIFFSAWAVCVPRTDQLTW